MPPRIRGSLAWRPAGDPVPVRDHSFPDPQGSKITPYGVYDIAANRGFVSVGTSHDTAAFAVNALRRWWQADGAARYPARWRSGGGENALICATSAQSFSVRRSRNTMHPGEPGRNLD